ncbi:MAG: DMT family transporter [Clostridiaceae bacterium]
MKAIAKQSQTKGYMMIFAGGMLWGTIGLFVKLLSSTGASSELAAFVRLLTGLMILVPVILILEGKEGFKIDKKYLLHCLILGVFTQAFFNYSYNMCIGSVGIATAAILLYTAPVFVCILSAVFFSEKIGKQKLAALALNLMGCFVMVTGGDIGNINVSMLGVFLGLFSGFLYSLSTIVGKIASGNCKPLTIMFYSFLFGTLTLVVIAKPWLAIQAVSGFNFWIFAFGFGLLPTVGAYLLYFSGLSHCLELSKVPVIASVETIVSILIGILLFNEPLGFARLAGIAGVLSSIVIMNLKYNISGSEKEEYLA